VDNKLHEELLKNVKKLKLEVSSYSLHSLTSTIAVYLRQQNFSGNNEFNLISPVKQCFYLIGIMLTTPEPIVPKNLDKRRVGRLVNLLNDIFYAYGWMFWPSKEDKDNLTPEWYRCREVAMPTFTHYFNTSLIASVEQIKKRIIEYLQPFDDVLGEEIGLSSLEVIEIVDSISKLQQSKLDEIYNLTDKEKDLRLELLKRAKAEDWDRDRLSQETQSSEYADFVPIYFDKIDTLFSFSKSDLITKADVTEKFFSNFSIRRKSGIDFTYITEENPAENNPLFTEGDDRYFCPLINALYIAVFRRMEALILKSMKKDAFLKVRDKTLEKSGAELFVQLIGNNAQCFCGLFETKDLHYEHDIIVICGRNLYIVEAKASPPIEPFRDPEKAYARLKSRFKGDTGIQKGFEQANRIRTRLQNEGEFWLYNNKSERFLELKSQEFDYVFCICLTRDNYGPIATNLNLLLEKTDDDIYPWVINIYDLESLVEAFNHLDLKEADLIRYINQRLQLHGKVFGTDELEYFGYFLKHKHFPDLNQLQADMMVLDHNESDIFDEIYVANQSGEKIVIDVVEPVLTTTNLQEILLDEERKRKKRKYNSRNHAAEATRKRNKKLEKLSRRKNRK
jgi:hypothetical protein